MFFLNFRRKKKLYLSKENITDHRKKQKTADRTKISWKKFQYFKRIHQKNSNKNTTTIFSHDYLCFRIFFFFFLHKSAIKKLRRQNFKTDFWAHKSFFLTNQESSVKLQQKSGQPIGVLNKIWQFFLKYQNLLN